MDDVWAGMDLKTLYKSSWGAKNARGEEFDELVRTDFEPRRLRMQQEGVEQGWLRPARRVRLLPRARPTARTLVIFDEGGESELGRLQFPRQERHDRLCLPTTSAPIDDDERDIVAFQVVTVGREAQDHVDALYAAEEYSEQYFAHGIAIAATEGMAEALHRRVKREMGIERRPGPALLVGLSGVPRPRAPRAGVRPARRPGGDRHRPHLGVPARPGAVDGRDRRAPSVGGLLQRAPLRPRHGLTAAPSARIAGVFRAFRACRRARPSALLPHAPCRVGENPARNGRTMSDWVPGTRSDTAADTSRSRAGPCRTVVAPQARRAATVPHVTIARGPFWCLAPERGRPRRPRPLGRSLAGFPEGAGYTRLDIPPATGPRR